MSVVVTGTVKDYAWGMIDGMVPWTGRGTGKPQAELWYGVHPSGPSMTLDGHSAAGVLPPERVPLLVKILAASNVLSVQVHPDAPTARRGLAEQDSGRRTYVDGLEKTEMIVAMTEFKALAGWREPRSAARILSNLGYPEYIQAAASAGRWSDAARLVMAGRPEPGPWDPGRMRRALDTDDPMEAATLADVAIAYPEDPAVGVAAMMAYHHLEPGDGLFVPAGVLHAYFRGVCLEVMTASDNVLRLGLTTKEIAVDEAVRATRSDRAPTVLAGTGPKSPPGSPFWVAVRRGVDTTLGSGRYRVVLAIDGTVHVASPQSAFDLAIGQAVLIAADDPATRVWSDSMVALVVASPGQDM